MGTGMVASGSTFRRLMRQLINMKYWNFVFAYRSTGKCATQKLKKNIVQFRTCSHLMAILKSENQNNDFLMILA